MISFSTLLSNLRARGATLAPKYPRMDLANERIATAVVVSFSECLKPFKTRRRASLGSLESLCAYLPLFFRHCDEFLIAEHMQGAAVRRCTTRAVRNPCSPSFLTWVSSHRSPLHPRAPDSSNGALYRRFLQLRREGHVSVHGAAVQAAGSVLAVPSPLCVLIRAVHSRSNGSGWPIPLRPTIFLKSPWSF